MTERAGVYVQALPGSRRPAVGTSAFVVRQSLNDEELVRRYDWYSL